MTTAMRTCKNCNIAKPTTEYWRHPNSRNGLDTQCRDCRKITQRKYRIENAEKLAAKRRERKDIQRLYHLKLNYGLSGEEYQAMLDRQGNACAICRQERKLVVDHCHATGVIRGLLCYPCNSALGQAKDNPERLRAMAAYLEEPSNFINIAGNGGS